MRITKKEIKEIAEQIGAELNIKCTYYTEANMWSLGETTENQSYRRMTSVYSNISALYKAMNDMLEGIRLGKKHTVERTYPIPQEEHNTNT